MTIPDKILLYKEGTVPVITSKVINALTNQVAVSPFKAGHYFVTETDGAKWQFAVLPTLNRLSHFSTLPLYGTFDPPVVLDAINPKYLRGLGWNYIQPDVNIWQWEVIDYAVQEHCVKRNQNIVFIAGSNFPSGVDIKSKASCLDAFRNLLKNICQRYSTEVSNGRFLIEIWNEPSAASLPPPVDFIGDNNDWYMALWNVALEVKVLYPSLRLVAGAWQQAKATLGWEKYQSALSKAYIGDWHNYHYSQEDRTPEGNTIHWSCRQEIGQIRKVVGTSSKLSISEYGLAGKSALGVVWPNSPATLDWRKGAFRGVRANLAFLSLGVEFVQPHSGRFDTLTSHPEAEMIGYESGPKPQLSFILAIHQLLEGGTCSSFTQVGELYRSEWKFTNKKIVFLWTKEGVAVPLSEPKSYKNIFGNTTGATASSEPIYYEEPLVSTTPTPTPTDCSQYIAEINALNAKITALMSEKTILQNQINKLTTQIAALQTCATNLASCNTTKTALQTKINNAKVLLNEALSLGKSIDIKRKVNTALATLN